jgi:uncharacterized protein YkwD
MRALLTLTALLAVLLVSACGGSGSANSSTTSRTTPPTRTNSSGAVVSADPTKGVLGPALLINSSGTHVIGRPGPISPKENRPTDAQQQGVAGGPACAAGSSMPGRTNLASMSGAIFCLLNAERAANGLPPLRLNRQLSRAAQPYAALMVRKRFFAHVTARSTPLSRIRGTGYVHGNWEIGENLAWGSGALATPRAIVNGWMHSPGHRANILHAAFRDIGIGIKLGAPGPGLVGGATYVTDFGRHS